MTSELILFIALGLVAVLSSIAMVQSRNTVYSALFLVITMTILAVFYLILQAPFIAMAQITVYAGAIMVLFLFVIMLLGTDRIRGVDALPWQRPLAIILALIGVVEAGYVVLFRSGIVENVGNLPVDFGSPEQVGTALFNQYLLPFEVVSILLLVAIVGAVVVSRRA